MLPDCEQIRFVDSTYLRVQTILTSEVELPESPELIYPWA